MFAFPLVSASFFPSFTGIQCATSIQPVPSSGIQCCVSRAFSIQPVLSSGFQCVTSIQHSASSFFWVTVCHEHSAFSQFFLLAYSAVCHEHSAFSQFFLLGYSVSRAFSIQPVLSSGIHCATSIQHLASSFFWVTVLCATSIQHSASSLVVWSAGLSDEIFAVDWKLKGTEVRTQIGSTTKTMGN